MKQVAVRRVQMAQAKRAPRDGNKIRPHPFAITVRILMGVQRLRTYDRPRAHILPTPYGPGPSVRCTSSRGGRSAAISVSRRCHKSPRLQWAAVDVPGQFVARHAVLRAPVDTCKRPESTSQAEYAGSIPVIGSTNPQHLSSHRVDPQTPALTVVALHSPVSERGLPPAQRAV